jgi:hypothetical protein
MSTGYLPHVPASGGQFFIMVSSINRGYKNMKLYISQNQALMTVSHFQK